MIDFEIFLISVDPKKITEAYQWISINKKKLRINNLSSTFFIETIEEMQ